VLLEVDLRSFHLRVCVSLRFFVCLLWLDSLWYRLVALVCQQRDLEPHLGLILEFHFDLLILIDPRNDAYSCSSYFLEDLDFAILAITNSSGRELVGA
jgi:hypothetical protein